MTDIRDAKQTLAAQIRHVDGFHGVGIAKHAIRLYARPDSPVVHLVRSAGATAIKAIHSPSSPHRAS